MINILNEFDNTDNKNNRNTTQVNAIDLAKKYKFTTENSTEKSGLLVSPNGMIAVQFDIEKNNIVIRPDNNLALGSSDLSKFKQDLSLAEKLAGEISNIN